MTIETALLLLRCAAVPAAVVLIVLLRRALARLLTFCGKAAGALCALALLSHAGVCILGANLVNALAIAALGVPGLAMLLFLRFTLGA